MNTNAYSFSANTINLPNIRIRYVFIFLSNTFHRSFKKDISIADNVYREMFCHETIANDMLFNKNRTRSDWNMCRAAPLAIPSYY